MRFLQITFYAETEEELDTIYDYMRTTCDSGEIVTEEGLTFVPVETDAQLVDELLCLGECIHEMEIDGIEEPFFVEIVHRSDADIPVDCAPPAYLQ